MPEGQQEQQNEQGEQKPEEKQLAPEGERALERVKAELKDAKAAAKANADAAKRLAEIEEANKDANQKAVDAATKKAREEATKEIGDRYKRRIITAEIKAAAGGKLADPADAVRMLDLADFDLNDNDEVDSKAVEKAIADLIKAKPYLAAKNVKTGGGGYQADPESGQGASGGPPNQLGSAVEAAAAAMRQTLRLPPAAASNGST